MRKIWTCAVVLLGAAWGAAQELPMPRKVPAGEAAKPSGAEERRAPAPGTKATLDDFKKNLEKLQREREALGLDRAEAAQESPEGTAAGAAEHAAARAALSELLARIAVRKAQPKPPAPAKASPPVKPAPVKTEPAEVTLPPIRPAILPEASADPVPVIPAPQKVETPSVDGGLEVLDARRLADSLFRANKLDEALKAYRLINLNQVRDQERPGVQYMIATCLRRLGKTDEAANLYREVAATQADEVLAECARWQLSSLRWQRDLQAQLRELERRKKSVEAKP